MTREKNNSCKMETSELTTKLERIRVRREGVRTTLKKDFLY
jgi:hypothetical protein